MCCTSIAVVSFYVYSAAVAQLARRAVLCSRARSFCPPSPRVMTVRLETAAGRSSLNTSGSPLLLVACRVVPVTPIPVCFIFKKVWTWNIKSFKCVMRRQRLPSHTFRRCVPARAGAESRRTGGRGELPGLCRLEAGALIALMPAPIRQKGKRRIKQRLGKSIAWAMIRLRSALRLSLSVHLTKLAIHKPSFCGWTTVGQYLNISSISIRYFQVYLKYGLISYIGSPKPFSLFCGYFFKETHCCG